MTYSPDLLNVARRVVWYLDPEAALVNRRLFLAHVMTYGTLDDVLIVRDHYSTVDFVDALTHAPAGIFDPRSWAYWNLVYRGEPVPPLPRRHLPDAA